MKKIFTLILVSILLITVIALTSCKETPVVTEPPHVHTFADEVVPQNCTYPGYTKHVCDCGYNYYDTFVDPDETTHGFVVVEEVAHTCTNYGYVKSACQWCNLESSIVIPPSHTLGEWSVYQPETCTENGEERLNCTVEGCEYYESREILAHHTFGEGIVTAPTCDTEGYTMHQCINCTESDKRDIVPATGHTLSDWTVVEGKAVTCLVDGEEERHCTVDGCEYSETQVITAHHIDEHTVATVTAPTCTEVGYTTYTCDVCEFHKVGNYTSPAHDFADWTTIKAATETIEGLESRTCKVEGCGAVETRIIPVTQPDATTPPSNEGEQ